MNEDPKKRVYIHTYIYIYVCVCVCAAQEYVKRQESSEKNKKKRFVKKCNSEVINLYLCKDVCPHRKSTKQNKFMKIKR